MVVVEKSKRSEGEKVVGFKELFWKEKTLDEVIKSRRNGNKENN